jgi:hypothetical protein
MDGVDDSRSVVLRSLAISTLTFTMLVITRTFLVEVSEHLGVVARAPPMLLHGFIRVRTVPGNKHARTPMEKAKVEAKLL